MRLCDVKICDIVARAVPDGFRDSYAWRDPRCLRTCTPVPRHNPVHPLSRTPSYGRCRMLGSSLRKKENGRNLGGLREEGVLAQLVRAPR